MENLVTLMYDPDEADALAEKIRRGEEISAEEMLTVFKTADAAGMLYYKMLTMVREQRSLTELPATLKEIIKTRAWQRWRWVGSTFTQNSLGAYLTSPPPNGVGIQLDTVKKLIADDPEAAAAFRDEMTGEPGHPVPNTDNIINRNKAEQGTSRSYTLARLKRERPDLFERVKAKKLSANAAAIETGFRTPPATPFERILKLLPKLTESERQQLLAALSGIDLLRS
jgi:hypothetical protein